MDYLAAMDLKATIWATKTVERQKGVDMLARMLAEKLTVHSEVILTLVKLHTPHHMHSICF